MSIKTPTMQYQDKFDSLAKAVELTEDETPVAKKEEEKIE